MNLKDVKMDFVDVINEDIALWEKLNNKDRLLNEYMQLIPCANSAESGLYQLILNGHELWLGTLREINAIVKTMVYRVERNDFLND